MKIALKQNSFLTSKYSKILIEFITALLIILWVYVGITKLIDFRSFRAQMLKSPLFGSIGEFVTFAGPILELVVAVLLIPKRTRLVGMVFSGMLMVFFTGYVYYLMTYIPHLPCSCGGIISELNWPQHFILNIVLTIMSLFAAFLLFRERKDAIRK